MVGVIPGRVGQEEPTAAQIIEKAIGLERGNRLIEGGAQVGLGGEDEAEVFAGQGLADELELIGVGADVTRAGSLIHQHHVDVALDEGLHRSAEGLEDDDAWVLLIAIEHAVDGGVEVGGAGL